MAGHSKWANIKHRKAGQDAKRGKVFTKIIRELTVASKLGGGNVADNPRLRAIVDKALSANMTRDTIDRAIARGAGASENENLQELTYEGYGPGGVAILCETLTDNKNRTVAEVRHGFSKFGCSMGTSGSVAYLFERTGIISFPNNGCPICSRVFVGINGIIRGKFHFMNTPFMTFHTGICYLFFANFTSAN